MKIGDKVKIHKPIFPPKEVVWWVDGMDKYDGYVGTIEKTIYNAEGQKVFLSAKEHVYSVEGAVGKNNVPYWFGEGCLEEL